LLELEQQFLVQRFQRLTIFQPQFDVDDFLDLRQEPRIDVSQLMHFFQRETLRECIADIPDTIRSRLAQFFLDGFVVGGFFVHAVDADFQTAQCFLERFLEGTANRHHFTDRLHLGCQMIVGLREFSNAKRGILVTT